MKELNEFLPIIISLGAIIVLAVFFHFVPFFLWLSAKVSGVKISLMQLFLMRIRNVPPQIIVPSLIEAHKAGLSHITRDNLEAHYMTGGHVQRVVHALVSASKANIDLSLEKATAIDLAGRDDPGECSCHHVVYVKPCIHGVVPQQRLQLHDHVFHGIRPEIYKRENDF